MSNLIKFTIKSSLDTHFSKDCIEIPKFLFCEEMRMKHGLDPMEIVLKSYNGTIDKDTEWLGFLRGYLIYNSFWIDVLFIKPNYRCLGIGKSLLNHVMSVIQADFIQVETFTFQAEGFYKKMGFVEFARIPYFDDISKVYFKKSLK